VRAGEGGHADRPCGIRASLTLGHIHRPGGWQFIDAIQRPQARRIANSPRAIAEPVDGPKFLSAIEIESGNTSQVTRIPPDRNQLAAFDGLPGGLN
jgi:hypothetical protein